MFDGIDVIRNAPMRDYTTLKLGGPADWLAFPETEEQLAHLLKEAKLAGIPVTVIGHGSNLLVLDGGIRGLVIRVGQNMSRIRVEGTTVWAQGGAMMGAVAAAAADAGLTGLEFASGIPGTIGGGATMNAGAYGGELSHVITGVDGLLADGTPLHLNTEEMAFGYRTTAVDRLGMTVTAVTVSLTKGDPEEIRERMRDLNSRRAEKQPLSEASAGSTFKRPEGYFAGGLIEECGLKGFHLGNAKVSEKHAGFLINLGGTAKEFLDLIKYVQDVVMEKKGVRLEPEIRIIGEEA